MSRSNSKRDTWKPVRYTRDRVERYCSPACGAHCTWAAYNEAWADAEKSRYRLGSLWKVYIWENLGWHWKVVRKDIEVWSSVDGTYVASYRGPYWIKSCKSPQAAVRALVEMVRKSAGEILQSVGGTWP